MLPQDLGFPSCVTWIQPQNTQTPSNIYTDWNPTAPFCLIHTQTPQSIQFEQNTKKDKNHRSPLQQADISQVIKNLFPPYTWYPKKQHTRRSIYPTITQASGYNILNHMTKFKILYLLNTTGKSQMKILEWMKKDHVTDWWPPQLTRSSNRLCLQLNDTVNFLLQIYFCP